MSQFPAGRSPFEFSVFESAPPKCTYNYIPVDPQRPRPVEQLLKLLHWVEAVWAGHWTADCPTPRHTYRGRKLLIWEAPDGSFTFRCNGLCTVEEVWDMIRRIEANPWNQEPGWNYVPDPLNPRIVDRVLERVRNVRVNHGRGNRWVVECPLHGGDLNVTEGDDGRTLLYCTAGCDWRQIVEALGLVPADLFR